MKVLPDDEEDTYLFIEAKNVVVGTAFLDAGWVRFISAQSELSTLESRRYRSVTEIRRAIWWMRLMTTLRKASRWIASARGWRQDMASQYRSPGNRIP
jgi:hypothetical protein